MESTAYNGSHKNSQNGIHQRNHEATATEQLRSGLPPMPTDANEAIDMAQGVIRKYPAVTLGVAVVTGLVIGWMVKRR